MHYWGDYGWGGMGWMMFFWPVLLLLFAVLMWYLLTKQAGPGPVRGPDPDSPELILKRRYARGEIDREEYERRLNDVRR